MLPVHLKNFSPVDLAACSSRNKTKMVERLRLLYGFVDCFNFTSNSAVEKHTSQKLCHFCHCCWDSEAFLSKDVSSRSPGLNCHMEKCSSPIPKSRSQSPASHLKQLNFFRRKGRRGEISEIEPGQSTGVT